MQSGKIKVNRYKGRLLSQNIRGRHYQVELSKGDRIHGSRHHSYVHHLVLEAFVGPRPAGMMGLHWDDDHSNNHLENLRWGTRSDNTKDSVRNGTHNQARKTECPQGHKYTPENTYFYEGSGRMCKTCIRERAAAR